MAPKRKLPISEDATDQESRPKRVLRSSKTAKDEPEPETSKPQVADRLKTAKVQKSKSSKAKRPIATAKSHSRQADEEPSLGTAPPSRLQRPNYCKKEDRAYWLMKAEPNSRLENGVDIRFSIDDLASKTKPEPWDGIRNHVAKNNLLAMRKGDYAFFYHSNCKIPGIVGTMKIVGEAEIDPVQFDPASPYYDPKSSREKPKWFAPFVEFREKFDEIVSLEDLKKYRTEGLLNDMEVLKMSRLSVTKVDPSEWSFVMGIIGGRRLVETREGEA